MDSKQGCQDQMCWEAHATSQAQPALDKACWRCAETLSCGGARVRDRARVRDDVMAEILVT